MSWVQAHAGSPHSTQKQLQEHHVLLPAESQTLPHESNSSSSQCWACYTKAAPPNATRKQLLSELSCVRWVQWVVRWEELCEMSCVSCEMSCVSCEMSCVKELGWSSVRGHESSSTKCHTKAALEWVELCEMSCVSCEMRGVVWDELYALCETTWVKLSERRSNAGGEGGEGAEYKPKNKNPTQRCEEKNHTVMSCVMMSRKKATRRIMLQRYNDKITQK